MRVIQIFAIALMMVAPALAEPPQKAAELDQGEKTQPVSFWMEKKLEYSQEMLRGLAIGDMKLVATKAEQMRVLSKVEGWIRKGTPGYTAQLQAFDFANAEIKRHARLFQSSFTDAFDTPSAFADAFDFRPERSHNAARIEHVFAFK